MNIDTVTVIYHASVVKSADFCQIKVENEKKEFVPTMEAFKRMAIALNDFPETVAAESFRPSRPGATIGNILQNSTPDNQLPGGI